MMSQVCRRIVSMACLLLLGAPAAYAVRELSDRESDVVVGGALWCGGYWCDKAGTPCVSPKSCYRPPRATTCRKVIRSPYLVKQWYRWWGDDGTVNKPLVCATTIEFTGEGEVGKCDGVCVESNDPRPCYAMRVGCSGVEFKGKYAANPCRGRPDGDEPLG